MNITTILIIVNVFAAITMIALTLMQSSKSDMGSAFGGGGSQSMFGSRGSSNFLSKSTALMCAIFFLTSIGLAYTYAKRNQESIVDTSVIEQSSEVQSVELPSAQQIENSVQSAEAFAVPEATKAELEQLEDNATQQLEALRDKVENAIEQEKAIITE